MSTMLNVYDFSYGGLPEAAYLRRGLERALFFSASASWPTEVRTLEELAGLLGAELLLDHHEKESEEVVLDLPQSVISVELSHRGDAMPAVTAHVRTGSRQAAQLELARLKELLPRTKTPRSERISVVFWYRAPNGAARKVSRRLEAPAWSAARRNYPTSTREALEPCITDVKGVVSGGRLILWHGEPGTGKTSALRTLARENPGAVEVQYVLDPETFFGSDAGYFVNVLFNDDEQELRKMRLLVLEDCDELLSADAKERAGQGLARLLNLVDGLIGQGLNIAVLITTNEYVGGFHPAVSRPGRCGATVSFDLFSRSEAADWLASHEVTSPVGDRVSLADLIALRDRRHDPQPQRPQIGFVIRP